MGNIFTPPAALNSKQSVQVVGFPFSKEHVPKELYRYGKRGIVVHTTKMAQSRSDSPVVYVTRVYFPEKKHYETFLTKDLVAY